MYISCGEISWRENLLWGEKMKTVMKTVMLLPIALQKTKTWRSLGDILED